MTGMSYQVTVDNTSMEAGLKRRLAQMDDLTPFHAMVGEHMLLSLDERFETETAPDGTPWQRHAPATIANRLARFGNAPLTILRQSGHLAGSFNYRANAEEMRLGTPVVYAAIHHFGGEAGVNRKVTIPPRPILGLSPDNERAINEMAEDWLTE